MNGVVKYFSGFCLHEEVSLFSEFIPQDEACIVGFSYGAIGATKFAQTTSNFFKKLILLSPAFYCHTTDEFKVQQLQNFVENPELYALKLLKKTGFDESYRSKFGVIGTSDELKELLYFDWGAQKFDDLLKKNIKIEVFIGGQDRVVDPNASMNFFKNFSTVYCMKNKNHFLR